MKKKRNAHSIAKTLDAQISKRQQYVEAEKQERLEFEKKALEDNRRHEELHRSQQQEWKEQAKRELEDGMHRHQLHKSMKVHHT